MTDPTRKAFEDWTIGARGNLDIRRNLDGSYRVASRNVEFMVWQAAMSHRLEVTDERVKLVALAIRRGKFERTGRISVFDYSMPLSEPELDDARTALTAALTDSHTSVLGKDTGNV